MPWPSLDAMQRQLHAEFPLRLVPLPGGREIGWREAGPVTAEMAVVLLHGISSGAASWLGVAQQMSRWRPDLRVLAWDAPGYGASTPLPLGAPTDEDYAQVLQTSLSALGVKRCVLVGHSLGALMAAAHARCRLPGQVSDLVLISPAGGYGAPERAAQGVKVRAQRLAALQEYGVTGLAAAIDQRLAAPDTPEVARQWMRYNAARMQAGGYAQAVELLCGSDLGCSIGQLSMPVHVWVGDQDIVTPPSACSRWAQALGAQYQLMAGGGHALPVEQPALVAQKLAHLRK